MRKQNQVGQLGATCESSKEWITDRQTDRPTDGHSQIEVLCRTKKVLLLQMPSPQKNVFPAFVTFMHYLLVKCSNILDPNLPS